ncbi:GDSL-type esterase/lipase family protein [Agreia sp. Leaf244]|uniref:GDSL-type esterase/lipase family protein n=1 Tax=Agreia sp. Leaf244 TaxID=1736305 RepID=UPI000AC5A03C|nr:GDSL-type esterase/lipase family protein [Agreia sp. Leaf244]
MKRHAALAVILVAAFLTSSGPAAGAALDGGSTAPVAVEAATVEPVMVGSTADTVQDNAPVIVVLDLSGSMNDDDGSGMIKLTGAKRAVDDAIRNIPSSQPFGLWTYPGGSDACGSGSFAIVPSRITDPNGTIATVDALTADGGTPTGPALLSAVGALTAQKVSAATLVLVSDGESNCGEGPCDVAKQLVGTGFDLTVHTVGFQVSDQGRAELTCVAGATGGSYIDVDDGDHLNTTLRELTRASLSVQASGRLNPLAGVPARITATVTNRSTIAATDVQLNLSLAGGAPAGLVTSLRVGNLRPGASAERTWTISTGIESPNAVVSGASPQEGRAFTISGWGRNADRVAADGMIGARGAASGGADLSEHIGDILRAPIDAGHPVVVMGDSYSSGEGTFDYVTPPDDVSAKCHRSDRTYLIPELGPGNAVNLACSGAVAWDFYYSGRDGTPPQLEQIEHLPEAPGAVVMTLGGNDIGFEKIIRNCIMPGMNVGCDHSPRDVETWIGSADSMRTWLAPVYEDVWRAINTPKHREEREGVYAPVIVLAYPQMTHATKFGACGSVQITAGLKGIFGPGEVRVANELAAHLNAAIKAAVADARQAGYEVYFVPDTADVTLPNHTLCDGADSYINGVVGIGKPESLHPNTKGYAAETGAIITWSESVEEQAPEPDLIGTPPDREFAAPWGARPPARVGVDATPSIDGLLLQNGQLGVQGSGYLPGTPVTVTMHSTPVVLGVLVADEHGRIGAMLRVPFAVPLGKHDLLISGSDDSGAFREERIPVSVLAQPPAWVELAFPLAGAAAIVAVVFGGVWWRTRRPQRAAGN